MKKILHLIAALFAISLSTKAQTQPALGLGAAQEFAVLGSSSVTSLGSTLVYADLGTSPGVLISGFLNSPVPGPGVVLGEIRPGGAEPAAAQVDALTTYNTLGSLTPTQNLTGQQLGKGFSRTPEAVAGTVLGPGVYRYDGNALLRGQLRFDGRGKANSLFVIQVNGDLVVEDGSVMSVQNGAGPNNIFFRVTGNIVDGNGELVGTAAALKGNLLVQNDITLSDGTTHEGRLLSLNGDVFLSNNTIFLPNIIETDLAINKTVDRSIVAVGDTITYTITVRNQGPDDATGVRVTETFPPQIAFIDYTSFINNSPANFAYNPATGVFTIGNLAFGQTATIRIRAKVIASNGGAPILNRVRVVGDQPDPDGDDNEDEEPVVVPNTTTDLQVIKTVDKTRASLNDPLTYTVTVRNNGPNAATGVSITDVLPLSQITLTSQPTTTTGSYNVATGIWTIGNLASGQSATLTVNATIAIASGTIVNTAVVRGNQADGQPANNTSTVVTVVGPQPGGGPFADLQVVKQVDKTRATPGETITYTITARNNGPIAATGVTITDVFPLAKINIVSVTGGTFSGNTWTIGNLAANQEVRIIVTATIRAGATGAIVNTAIIDGNEADERPENNTSTVVTVIGNNPGPDEVTDLQVVKTVDRSRANVGDFLNYTVTVQNNGPTAATGVLVVDMLPTTQLENITTQLNGPAGMSFDVTTGLWTIGNLAVGQSATLTVRGRVTTVGTIVNTATVSGNEADPRPDNNTSTVITIVGGGTGAVTDLETIKTVNKTRATVGEILTYTIIARNNGPSTATGVILQDVLPVNQLVLGTISVTRGTYSTTNGIWTIGDLAIGQTETMTVTATIRSSGTIVNTAVISGNESDQQPTNNTSTVVTVVGTQPGGGPFADLQVVKSVDKTSANQGDVLTYTITARNNGPANATGVTVTDQFPAGFTITNGPTVPAGTSYNPGTGIWTIGNLGVGQSVQLTVNGTVNIATGVLVNTAVINGNEADERPENNTSTVITVIGGNAGPATDLQVVKVVDKTRANVGDDLNYTITVRNNGPNDATGVFALDVLPTTQLENITTQLSGPVGMTYTITTGLWTIGNLAVGESAILTVRGRIRRAGTIVNTATVLGNEADPQPGNNTSTVITIVGGGAGVADLRIEKSVDKAEVTLGDQVIFTLRATNIGPDEATGVTVADLLPTGFQFVSASPATEYNSATGVWTIGTLTAGAPARELTITAVTTLVGRIRNVAVIDGNEVDPDDDNDQDDAEVCVRPATPVISNSTVCAGNAATFTIAPMNGVTQYLILGLSPNPVQVTVGAGGNTLTVPTTGVGVGTYTLSFIAVNNNSDCSNSLPATAILTIGATPGTPVIQGPAATICSGNIYTYSVTTPQTGVTYTWRVTGTGWSIQGATTGEQVQIMAGTGVGTITVTATNSCDQTGTTDSETVTPSQAPVIIDVSEPCVGLAFQIESPVAGVTYTWTAPGFTITGQGTASVTLRADNPSANPTVSVRTSTGGCESAPVAIDISNTDTQISIPNVITPNGDGKNDRWVVRNLEKFPDNDLTIYNRWGNEVYKVRSYNNQWEAAGLEEATYFYVLRVRGCNGQEQVFRGPVQVVR